MMNLGIPDKILKTLGNYEDGKKTTFKCLSKTYSIYSLPLGGGQYDCVIEGFPYKNFSSLPKECPSLKKGCENLIYLFEKRKEISKPKLIIAASISSQTFSSSKNDYFHIVYQDVEGIFWEIHDNMYYMEGDCSGDFGIKKIEL